MTEPTPSATTIDEELDAVDALLVARKETHRPDGTGTVDVAVILADMQTQIDDLTAVAEAQQQLLRELRQQQRLNGRS